MKTPPPLPNTNTGMSGKTKSCLGCLGITAVMFIGSLILIPNLGRTKESPKRQEKAAVDVKTASETPEKNSLVENKKQMATAVEAQKTPTKEQVQHPKQSEGEQRASRRAELDAKTEKFKQWALQNTAVTDIAINSNRSMFVTLKPEKYTNRDNVRVIAETLARYYANQVGIDYAVCRVYLGNEEYAKGIFSR